MTKSRKILDKQEIDFEKHWVLARKIDNFQPYLPTLWERCAWVKQRTKTYKMKEGFFKRRQLLNNVNTGINFSSADNEAKNGNLNIYTT